MREELITLTQKEHERLSIIRKVLKRELRQKEAGALMGVTDRQVRNLVRKVKEKGAHGLAHGNRGKPSPRRMPGEVVARIVGVIKDRYRDFKPKFAAEKLWKRDKIKVSDEKLRQIMIEAGLWRVHRRKTAVHQWRERKSYYGEMVQMDGSHHAWLETRGPKLVLMGLKEIREQERRPQLKPVVRPKPPKYTPPPNHPWRGYADRFPSPAPERP